MKLKYEKMCTTIDDNKKLEKCPQIMWERITSKSLTYTLHLFLYLMMAGCSNSKTASNSGEIVHTKLVDRKTEETGCYNDKTASDSGETVHTKLVDGQTEETVKSLKYELSDLWLMVQNGERYVKRIEKEKEIGKIESNLTFPQENRWKCLEGSWRDLDKRLNDQIEELRAVISYKKKRTAYILDSEKRAALLSQCTTLRREGNKQLNELAQFGQGLEKIRVTAQEGSLRHSSQKTDQGIDSEQTPKKSDISPSGSRSTQEEKKESVHRPLGQPENNNRPETLQKPLVSAPNPSAVSPTQDRGQGLGVSEESVDREEQKDSGETVHTKLVDGQTEETVKSLKYELSDLWLMIHDGKRYVKRIKKEKEIREIESNLTPPQKNRWKCLEGSWRDLDKRLNDQIEELGDVISYKRKRTAYILDSEKRAALLSQCTTLRREGNQQLIELVNFGRGFEKIRVTSQKGPLRHSSPKTEQDTDSEKTLKQNNISPSGSHSTQEERKELEEKSLPTVEVVNVKGGATQSSSPRSVIDSQPVSQLSSSVQKENAITTNDNEEPNSALPSVHSTREWYKACEKSLKKFEEIEKKRTGGSS